MQLWIGALVSGMVHVGFGVFVMGQPKPAESERSPSTVAIEVATPEPEPEPEPEPKPEPEPERTLPAARAAEPPPQAAPPDEPSPPPAPEPAQPIDLGGLTLTNDGAGPGWSAPVARAPASRAPIVRPKPSAPPAVKPPAAPRLVASADLSRRPRPPALDAALARNYPRDLRQRAIGGVAVVRLVVGPDGRVSAASVVSESEPGFGAACQRTVANSRWDPPIDKDGRPVGTRVSYTCRFVVER